MDGWMVLGSASCWDGGKKAGQIGVKMGVMVRRGRGDDEVRLSGLSGCDCVRVDGLDSACRGAMRRFFAATWGMIKRPVQLGWRASR